jgi:hypothetical protein
MEEVSQWMICGVSLTSLVLEDLATHLLILAVFFMRNAFADLAERSDPNIIDRSTPQPPQSTPINTLPSPPVSPVQARRTAALATGSASTTSSPVAKMLSKVKPLARQDLPITLTVDKDKTDDICKRYAEWLKMSELSSARKGDVMRFRPLHKLITIGHQLDEEELSRHEHTLLTLIFETLVFHLFFADIRDVETVCEEASATLGEYLRDRIQVSGPARPNIASLIGNQFLSLSAFENEKIRPSRTRCYDFLFLHEIIFERLILAEDIRKKMGVEGTGADLQKSSNITLARILALEKRCTLKEVDHEVLKPAKV